MDTTSHTNPAQGPVVGIIIVIIVIIVGAFYFFSQLGVVAPLQEGDDVIHVTDEELFVPTSASDDPDAIANDLATEDFEDIDSGMSEVQGEFGY